MGIPQLASVPRSIARWYGSLVVVRNVRQRHQEWRTKRWSRIELLRSTYRTTGSSTK